MRVEAPGQLVIFLETFNWSLEDGTPSYHVRSCIEFHRNGRLSVSGDILVTTGSSTFTAEEIPYVGEMTLRAKRKSVEKGSARGQSHAPNSHTSKNPKHGLATRKRVVSAYEEGRDWELVASCSDIPLTTARNIVQRGTADVKKRGGARAAWAKFTPEVEEALVESLEDNCQCTLAQMGDMLRFDFGVSVSTSLISKKLCDKLYTMKQVRVEPATCNEVSGCAIIGESAVVTLPPSKGANLQLQCAVSHEVGSVHDATRRGSIKKEINAAFVDAICDGVKVHPVYQEHFIGKKIVIVLYNAPAHNQMEDILCGRYW
ncbi:hypothetical protein C6341_g23132 [Phytophthora cactorum]|nr:hypothetical protein C6341_g23132 [Phytophthora cactorum]